MVFIMKRRNERRWSKRKSCCILSGIWGLLVLIQAKSASADSIDPGGMKYSSAPGAPWMETAVIIIVGLMVILAVGVIMYLHYQKRQDAQERLQREEAEREEQ